VLGSLLVAILVSVVLAGRSPSSPQSLSALFGGGETATPWGPVGPSDRDMLIKLRQANLFDGPTGEQAGEWATAPSVRQLGVQLDQVHAQLDAQLLDAADRLGVALPSQPGDQQKVWLNAITDATASGYDTTFVNLLRSAYGELLPLVAGVRAGTENRLVRQLAIVAGDAIGQNMRLLEGTGLVDYTLLPPSTAPAARLTAIGDYTVPVTLLLFLAAVLVCAMMVRELGRSGTPGGTRAGWLARAVGLAGSARDRALRSTRRRRVDRERMVTTAELIAVLNPANRDRPVSRPEADAPTAAVPRPRASTSERPPLRLGRTRGGRGW
jgi:predicted outer membrane protein